MAKLKIEWTIEAKLDLIDILDFYIKRNQSKLYSKKLNAIINQRISLIAENPFLGTPTDFKRVRVFVTDEYQIIYEIYKTMILIIMIWDCRRDPDDRIIADRVQ